MHALLSRAYPRLPYNLYCVGGDVKHYSIQSNPRAYLSLPIDHIEILQPVAYLYILVLYTTLFVEDSLHLTFRLLSNQLMLHMNRHVRQAYSTM